MWHQIVYRQKSAILITEKMWAYIRSLAHCSFLSVGGMKKSEYVYIGTKMFDPSYVVGRIMVPKDIHV